MFDAVEIAERCPKGCDAQLIKCFPELFICPKCRKAFLLATTWNGKSKFFRKTSANNSKKCREVLDSGKWKPIKNIDTPSSEAEISVNDIVFNWDDIIDEATQAIEKLNSILLRMSGLVAEYKKKEAIVDEFFKKFDELRKYKEYLK